MIHLNDLQENDEIDLEDYGAIQVLVEGEGASHHCGGLVGFNFTMKNVSPLLIETHIVPIGKLNVPITVLLSELSVLLLPTEGLRASYRLYMEEETEAIEFQAIEFQAKPERPRTEWGKDGF